MIAIIVGAVITAAGTIAAAIVAAVLAHKTREENTTQHGYVQETLIAHSEAIGQNTEAIKNARDDIGDVKNAVQKIADKLT